MPPGAVHLIVGGHTHHILNEGGLVPNNIVNGIPIVQAGKYGQFAGQVRLTVEQGRVTVTEARLTPTIEMDDDLAFDATAVRPLLVRVRPYRTRVLGEVADDPGLGTDAVMARFTAGESPLANFIADGLAAQARAHGYPVDLALVDASSVAGGLPAGAPLTYGDWHAVMPYPDTLTLLRLTGAQLCDLLADNARRLDLPGQPHTERGFIHTSRQVCYAIQVDRRGRPAAVETQVDGRPIAEVLARTFLVATTSFLRGPAAAWEAREIGRPIFTVTGLPVEHTSLRVRDLLVAYIVAHGGVLPAGGAACDGRLRVHAF